ncbi:MAG: tellurite resistance TerB family protein [Hyphomonadaceae bacterium]
MTNFFVSTLGKSSPEETLDWSQLVGSSASRTPGHWSVPEAFIAVLLAAVGCDGEIAAVEQEELIALVHRSRALKSLSPVQLTEINIRIVERLRDNEGALREACAALPNEMRLSLFAHALDLVLADGDLTEDEADFLNALILYLNLDGQSVEQIADVMTLKNRF